MEWEITTRKLPNLEEKDRMVVAGVQGGWYRPSDVLIADGRVYSVRNGRLSEVYAYMVLPEPPRKHVQIPLERLSQKKKEKPHQKSLISVLREKCDSDGIEPITPDWLREHLPTFCTEREIEILKMRFADGNTLLESGDRLGISKERVRQIERKAIRKIYARKYVESQIRCFEEPEERNISEIDIKCLDLSVRAYNGLKRGGIDTVEQLSECSEKDIKAIRNIGDASVEEIQKKLKQFLENGA